VVGSSGQGWKQLESTVVLGQQQRVKSFLAPRGGKLEGRSA
jgi:hypothetical protein